MDDAVRDPEAKLRYIEASLDEPVEYVRSAGLERHEFVNEALPELSLGALKLSTSIAGRRLAAVGQRYGLGLCTGSQRVALECPDRAPYFAVRNAAPDVRLVATGGLRSGVDLAMALALVAYFGAMAQPFLLSAHAGEGAVECLVESVLEDLRICMFASGASCVAELRGSLRPLARD